MEAIVTDKCPTTRYCPGLLLPAILLLYPLAALAQTCTQFIPPVDPLLQDAYISTAPLLSPTTVQYIDKNGETYTNLASPGQIIVDITAETPASAAQALFQSYGGTVIGQIPTAGFYVVQVEVGNEAGFIAAINPDARVAI